jgi:hypothetical protein
VTVRYKMFDMAFDNALILVIRYPFLFQIQNLPLHVPRIEIGVLAVYVCLATWMVIDEIVFFLNKPHFNIR